MVSVRTLRAVVERSGCGKVLEDDGAEAAGRAFFDGDQDLVACARGEARGRRRAAGQSAASATVVGQSERGEVVGRGEAFLAAVRRRRGARSSLPSRSMRPLPTGRTSPQLRKIACRCPRRVDSGRPRDGRRSPRRWRPCAPAPPHRRQPSGQGSAPVRGRRCRTSRHGWRRRRRQSPARSIAKRTGSFWIATSWTTWSSGALEEGRVDRAERLSAPPPRGPAAKVTACCSAMPTSKNRSREARREDRIARYRTASRR